MVATEGEKVELAGMLESKEAAGHRRRAYRRSLPGPKTGDLGHPRSLALKWPETWATRHIAVYDGKQWVSDFKQRNMSPYAISPPSAIYRFPDN